jgi:hypothetical protein
LHGILKLTQAPHVYSGCRFRELDVVPMLVTGETLATDIYSVSYKMSITSA